jgi:L-lactate dehydrogenase (cytochrome)
MLKDRGYMKSLIERAKMLGCPVLVFTVDLPVPGSRYRDIRSGFTGSSGLSGALNTAWDGITHPAWTWDLFTRGRPHTLGSVAGAVAESRRVTDFLSWIARNFDRSVTWADLDWVRETWDGPIVVKGVLDPQDARDAVKAGAQGLVVSNHGGRQLDGVRSSISALPAIADAAGGDLEVYMDGGVRSGLDVLKALALGAKACFVGRAWAYALGAGGQPQVAKMLGTLRAELAVAMILTGCATVSEAGRELLDRDV